MFSSGDLLGDHFHCERSIANPSVGVVGIIITTPALGKEEFELDESRDLRMNVRSTDQRSRGFGATRSDVG